MVEERILRDTKGGRGLTDYEAVQMLFQARGIRHEVFGKDPDPLRTILVKEGRHTAELHFAPGGILVEVESYDW